MTDRPASTYDAKLDRLRREYQKQVFARYQIDHALEILGHQIDETETLRDQELATAALWRDRINHG